jgi:colanic acid/amylovoran biosynthesis glycosyltransferase
VSVAAPRGDRRVLHLVPQFGAISETFVADRIAELDRLGWEGWVATRSVSNREQFAFPPDDRLLYERPTVVERIRWRLGAGGDGSGWVERSLHRARPDIVHAHFGWTAAGALPAVARSGVPMVVGFHGYDLTVFPRYGHIDLTTESVEQLREIAFPYRRLFEQVEHALVVSRFLEEKLRSLGFGGQVHVVPSGIRLDGFPFRGPRASGDAVQLLFIGRLVPYKGLDVLLRAMPRLAAPATLEVLGDGPARARSEALARELGIADQVAFRGARPHAEVVRALQRADLLVVPSKTMPTGQAEGLSNVVKEGLAVGVQVVASRSGGIPEVIPPPFRDELVPEDDPQALTQRLMWHLDRRETWEARARTGRAWVEEHFDWSRLAPRIAAVYRRALDRGPREPVPRARVANA